MNSAHACALDSPIHPPKLLPWLAAEACIDEKTALRLWQAAVLAASNEGPPGSVSLKVKAMAHFRDALAQERQNAGIGLFIRSLRLMQRRIAHQVVAFFSVLLMKSSQRVWP